MRLEADVQNVAMADLTMIAYRDKQNKPETSCNAQLESSARDQSVHAM